MTRVTRRDCTAAFPPRRSGHRATPGSRADGAQNGVGRDERGTALVELPIAFIALTYLALTLVALGQVLLDYQHLAGATRAAARYATRSEYDPARAPATAARRPATGEVLTFAQAAADPLPAGSVNASMSADNLAGRPGDEVTVTLTHTVGGGAYAIVTNTVNALGGLLGLPNLPTVNLHSSATAVYE
jgi:Flp pilus assembly protein TadG